jgi:hypothetical protein
MRRGGRGRCLARNFTRKNGATCNLMMGTDTWLVNGVLT